MYLLRCPWACLGVVVMLAVRGSARRAEGVEEGRAGVKVWVV